MRLDELDKKITQSDLDALEIFADRIFGKVGIDVEFTRHFLDRVNDGRNGEQITGSELTRLFKQEYKRWGKPIAQMGPDAEAVMKDLQTDINMPFALRWDRDNNELDLIVKTVMRKKDFKTSNKEFPVESIEEDREESPSATEMKISDLTISDAGMAIAQSVGGGSRTDAPLAVTKLPSGHVYLVNGYHRLVDAMQAGKDTVSVEYVPYEKVEILWKQEREQDIKYGKQFNEEVEVSLHGDAKKGYVLSKIEVSGDERNAGQGTKAMQDIVDRMDSEGAIIALTPDDAFGGNKNRLIKFYKRFGFVPNKGSNKDFRFRETLIRYPKTQVKEAFDNPYPFELIGPNDSQEFSALAQTPNGMLRMDFEATDYDNFGIDFSVGKSMGKTDAGDEFKVFATVVAMMKKWIKTVGIEHVESFDFGANKGEHASDGRAKLYTRFAKQLASKLGWRLEQSTTGNNDTAFFKLTNPNPVPREQEYWDALEENFKDGKVKGKSRPGRVKKSGASCNGSVTELRAKAKKASGEKAKMYHWCANMKAGKKK
jgi:GNAT superfamily N-acetyltransferase